MANFTEKAIKESFVKLLNTKALNKITVKDIVEDCGINRNSFYYHYQDVPDLLTRLIEEEAEELIEAYPTIETLDSALDVAIEFALANKKAAMHIYNSENRDIFERSLMKVCENCITKYINTMFPQQRLSDDDRRIVIGIIKCECYGVIIDWMSKGMNSDLKADHHRFKELIPILHEGARGISTLTSDSEM